MSKKKTVEKKLTPKDLDRYCQDFAKLMSKNKIPYMLMAHHPEDEAHIIANGGNHKHLIVMSQAIDMEAKEAVLARMQRDPAIIPEVVSVIDACTKHFGPNRAVAGKAITDLLYPKITESSAKAELEKIANEIVSKLRAQGLNVGAAKVFNMGELLNPKEGSGN